jgi:hypothetical protein
MREYNWNYFFIFIEIIIQIKLIIMILKIKGMSIDLVPIVANESWSVCLFFPDPLFSVHNTFYEIFYFLMLLVIKPFFSIFLLYIFFIYRKVHTYSALCLFTIKFFMGYGFSIRPLQLYPRK